MNIFLFLTGLYLRLARIFRENNVAQCVRYVLMYD